MLEIIEKLGGGGVVVGALFYAMVHYLIIAPEISERVALTDHLQNCKRDFASSVKQEFENQTASNNGTSGLDLAVDVYNHGILGAFLGQAAREAARDNNLLSNDRQKTKILRSAEPVCIDALKQATSEKIIDWTVYTATFGITKLDGVKNINKYYEPYFYNYQNRK